MNQQEYLQQFEQAINEMLAITRAKNQDYAGEGDAFANFRMIEQLNPAIRTEDGIFVRMTDKFIRIAHLLQRPAAVVDEKIEDTLKDLANYSIIMMLYLRAKTNA